MKISTILFCMVVFFSAKAQDTIKVNVEQRPTSFGIQPGFEMVVPQATPDEAIDLWKETITPRVFLKKTPKTKKIKDEWWTNNIVISDITSMPLTVITQISSFPGHIYIRVFFQSENGFLGSSGSDENITEAAKNYVRNYGVDLYRLAVENELSDEERKLAVLEKKLNKLERKNKSFGESISEVKQDQALLNSEVRIQSDLLNNDQTNTIGVVEQTSDDELASNLKSAEKELKRAQKAEDRYSRKIRKNEKEQRNLVLEIEKQQGKVEQIKDKLNNIK
ncbi:MAG: hypothetical protein JXR61_00165 [Prolixibacteraceae bacterium]|nr:hypothetical protein [Prolixibacteraceae bacterium]